jgi:hypothetical protein
MTDVKRQVSKLCASQDEMFKVMQNMMSNLVRIERSTAQRSEVSHASSGQDLQVEIVVAGGGRFGDKSVEVFNMATRTWRSLSEMNKGGFSTINCGSLEINQCRSGASSVIYQGGDNGGDNDNDRRRVFRTIPGQCRRTKSLAARWTLG